MARAGYLTPQDSYELMQLHLPVKWKAREIGILGAMGVIGSKYNKGEQKRYINIKDLEELLKYLNT